MDLVLKGYYALLDACADHPDWKYKIEEEIGQQVNYMVNNIEDDPVTGLKHQFATF
jgi:hypothetical protein